MEKLIFSFENFDSEIEIPDFTVSWETDLNIALQYHFDLIGIAITQNVLYAVQDLAQAMFVSRIRVSAYKKVDNFGIYVKKSNPTYQGIDNETD